MSTGNGCGCARLSQILNDTLSTLFPDAVFPTVYTGPLTEYVVWNYDAIPVLWAEGRPEAARYLVQVHLYLPHKKNPSAAILAIEEALFSADLTWPSVTDASDSDGQHYVLSCEYADGGGVYGFT